ncbi:hypothetical protein CEUSTIGMA_g1575.t1 [Chlamydomonas eustigma]|uniref:HIT domain-containing protein n=1 Tax=Chlamydomonas eustigma TaxID=1157962 RepID=A0A250WTP9_9CHLO|nr:hypothetical protein CEUSTIGMA_g1575.t1 [Chlamydomonas eustigma]|eukprot:GAX74126.1 hypothetical protein CEUSTIGMA_g1575.t1 [Chlamydomonas eustigma]
MFCGRQSKSPYYVTSRDFKEDCVFCHIVQGGNGGKDRILYKNERVAVFEDIRPAAATHLLVVPIHHIANTDSLETHDFELVKEMHEVGEKVLLEHCRPGAKFKFGYHQPPYRSVDHLHLHCFELPHSSLIKNLKYCIPSVWLSCDDLLKRLKNQ